MTKDDLLPGGATGAANEPQVSAHPERLLHELRVHQEELRAQNDELIAARDALAASLERYTDLYDFAPVAYFTITPESRVRQVNRAGAQLLGREADRIRDSDLRRDVAADSLAAYRLFLAEAFASGTRQSCELALHGAGGTIAARVEALVDRRRGECRLAVVDLSEVKRNAAIRESEQRFQVALANSPITVFEQDLDLRYTWIHNPMWGLASSQVIGRHNRDLMGEASATRLDTLLREVLASGEAKRVEVGIAAPGRESVCWDLSVHSRHGLAGELIGVIGAAADISERKQVERDLQISKTEAERANNAKSRFLAAASHDLRQPLGALALYVDVLKNKVASEDVLLVEHIKGCVTSMSGLLNDLLDVSKLTAGVVLPQLTDFSVDELLDQLVAVYAPKAELKGLRLRRHRSASHLTARSDRVWFGRIVSNLVANAVEYTQSGGILLGVRRRQGRAWVEICDTGIGIPEHQTSEIFEEFRQLDNAARTHGSGLGLAIVARAAALLGLTVRVRSQVGKGSLFAIELPLGSSVDPQTRKNAAAPPRPLRIALVEDNATVLRALSFVLEGAGHRVVAATSLRGVLQELGDGVPDVVVSDYRLPGKETGFDVIQTLRNAFARELPAVIITGDTDPGIMAEMSRHGIVIQHKPIDVDTLQLCIAKVTQ